jgi:actin-related protein 2
MRNFKLKVEDPPHRRHTVFTGAAVLAEIMRDSAEFWVTKAEFEEDPHRAAQRCGNHSSAR